MIYYLAQPYSKDPEVAITNVHNWVFSLRSHGYYVFSPILHTHHYDQWRKTVPIQFQYHQDYVDWDLALLKAFGKNVIMLLSNTAYEINAGDFSDIVPGWKEKNLWNVGNWFSDGCRREYQFARQYDIRVLDLESFLVGKVVEI